MKCPKCNTENVDNAKFCKKCGESLKKDISHQSVIKSIDKKDEKKDYTNIIIVALVIIVIVLGGIFAYTYLNSGNSSDDNNPVAVQNATATNDTSDADESDGESDKTQTTSAKPASGSSSLSILGGSFSTGSSLSDKTKASINVGSQHAGEDVIIQIWYSRDGNTLNDGNMVPKTVTSDGYINVNSANAFKYYPDTAEINVYDTNSNLLDSRTVYLSEGSGTQRF